MAERPIIMQSDSVLRILTGQKTQTRRAVKPQPVDVMQCPNVPGGLSYAHSLEFHEGIAPRCLCEPVRNPYGTTGDALWVREGWWQLGTWTLSHYLAEGDSPGDYLWRGFEPNNIALTDDMSYQERIKTKPVYNLEGITWAIGRGVRYIASHPEQPTESNFHGLTAKEARMAWRKRPSIHMPHWASRLTLIVHEVQLERLHDITPADALAEGVSSIEEYRKVWDRINRKPEFRWEDNPFVWKISFAAAVREIAPYQEGETV
jgi:hypothetical protein